MLPSVVIIPSSSPLQVYQAEDSEAMRGVMAAIRRGRQIR